MTGLKENAKMINVMRCLAGRQWGASCLAVKKKKKVYQALIKSVIDYGCAVYGSAAPSLLKKLNQLVPDF